MIFVAVVAALFVGYGTAYVASEDVRYLSRAAVEESRILQARQPIGRLAADSTTSAALRGQLGLVLQARDFAAGIGLEAKQTFTTYSDVGRDTLLLVLSAAPRNCLCPHTWKFPIVGKIPYKGFFDSRMARREADRLDAKGFDTYLRPAAAFSTLGWFNDPLLSTALTGDSVELAALVLHEIAHNTLYVKSATPFNESFAQLIGYRGAEAFFRGLGDSSLALRAADRWHDEIALSDYYAELSARLDSLYGAAPDSAAVDSGRAALAVWAREQLEGPVGARFRTYHVGRLSDRPINNARLIAARIYRTRLDLLDRWYQTHGADVRQSVTALDSLLQGVPGDSVFTVIEHALPAP